jgi:methyl-CpG-binding domain protein 4
LGIVEAMIPFRSPYSLIQEDLFPDEWKCFVACLMLNCTTRKQVEKILPTFFGRWPNPKAFLQANKSNVERLISPLGFGKRRTQRLFEMTSKYAGGEWKHASELPGVGEYASRSWEIFFQNKLGDDLPNDGALALYWKWAKGTKNCVKNHKI